MASSVVTGARSESAGSPAVIVSMTTVMLDAMAAAAATSPPLASLLAPPLPLDARERMRTREGTMERSKGFRRDAGGKELTLASRMKRRLWCTTSTR